MTECAIYPIVHNLYECITRHKDFPTKLNGNKMIMNSICF